MLFVIKQKTAYEMRISDWSSDGGSSDLVIGEGPARGWFESQGPEAVFAGCQSGDDLGRAVASMDVFFNPSITETFGNVTLEAMAAGVPVVAARATGPVDLID